MRKPRLNRVAAVTCILFFVTVFSFGNVAEAKRMSSAAAKRAAMNKVRGADWAEVEWDTDDGVEVYEVSLYKGNKEYDLSYRVSDGTLIKYGWDMENTSYGIQDRADVSEHTIRSKANQKVRNAQIISIHSKIDDGLSEYKVVMKKGRRQYKLEYNAKNAKLLGYEWELVSGDNSSGKYIGKQKAQQIALNKVPGATIIECKFEIDDGIPVYEVEMRKGMYEYELKIHAKTGNIIEFEKDIDD